MFQFKKSGLGMKEPENSNALPNSHDQIRTFKEDLEKFQKGTFGNEPQDDVLSAAIPEQKPVAEIPVEKPVMPLQPTNPLPQKETAPNPFQSIPTPPPMPNHGSFLPEIQPNGSNSFFAEKPPQKQKSRLGLILAIIFILVIAGGGAYYWFFIKNNSQKTDISVPVPVSPKEPDQSSENENENLRQLIVDTEQDSSAIKSSVEKFSSSFADTASENDLTEVKMLKKDGSSMDKKDFFSGFGLKFPESVLQKLSKEYSLFFKKEQGVVRIGIVFKSVTSSGLADEMKNWEPTMVTDLKSLYFGRNAEQSAPTFNSSRYNNADIRYSNILGQNGDSLDYSVISNFLIVGTSKNTFRTILDYMATK